MHIYWLSEYGGKATEREWFALESPSLMRKTAVALATICRHLEDFIGFCPIQIHRQDNNGMTNK
jgi:hypothetical protein